MSDDNCECQNPQPKNAQKGLMGRSSFLKCELCGLIIAPACLRIKELTMEPIKHVPSLKDPYAVSTPTYSDFVKSRAKKLPTEAEHVHHATTGIIGEAGELIDISKKWWIYNKEVDRTHMIEELGDLRFYYQMLLDWLGVTDEEVVEANIAKLTKRYPTGYSDQHAQARLDKVE